MKKILFAVVACLAIGFASCGNKTQAPAEVTDSVSVDAANVDEAVSQVTAALSEQIEAKDATKFLSLVITQLFQPPFQPSPQLQPRHLSTPFHQQ